MNLKNSYPWKITTDVVKQHILFLTDIQPEHHGHGGSVYPYFLLRALENLGLCSEVVLVNGGKAFGKPFSRCVNIIVPGWIHIGDWCISKSWREWGSFLKNASPVKRIRNIIMIRSRPLVSRTTNIKNQGSDSCGLSALNEYLMQHPSTTLLVNSPYLIQELSNEVISRHFVAVLTHDVIHERVEIYRRNGWRLDFKPLTRIEELNLLRLANLVVAISEEDRKVFSSYLVSTNCVSCFPPLYEPSSIFPKSYAKNMDCELRCLFIGGGAAHNRDTLAWLLNIWPAVIKRLPNVKLYVVGGVAESASSIAKEGVVLVGRVRNLHHYYKKCHLALAMVTEGSGVKIKLLEAVRYGLPAITSPEGLRGFPGKADSVFPTVVDCKGMKRVLEVFVNNPSELERLREIQYMWANRELVPEKLLSNFIAHIPN